MAINQGKEAEELSKQRRSLWMSAISRDNITETILKNDRVCSKHFVSGTPAKPWDRYNIDWVPTLNLGHNKSVQITSSDRTQAEERGQRANQKELKRKQQQERETERLKRITEKKAKLSNEGQTAGVDCQTAGVDSNKVETATQTQEFQYLFSEPTPSPQVFDEAYFRRDERKATFYTGLPSFDVLKTVFDHVSPFIKRKSQSLSQFQEYILTLMKLKLNLPLEDIAYRFNISLPTVSRIFRSWMVVLDVRLSPLIKWPNRDDLHLTMPQCFKYSFGNKTTVIIDCFEIFIDRPSNLLARAQTYSSYKSHNTVKVLVGITNVGIIKF